MRDVTDPRNAGGEIKVDGNVDPHAKDSVKIDMRRAVLLDHTSVAVVATRREGVEAVVLALQLGGRVNRSDDERAEILFLLSQDAAAGIVSEIVALASRMDDGAAFADLLIARLGSLSEEGVMGRD